MIYKQYDVVVVPFPFTEKLSSKRRPALILSNSSFNSNHDHVLLCMITSTRALTWSSDIVINDFKTVGLSMPCCVRFKLFTLPQSLILRTVGTMSQSDQKRIKRSLENIVL